jgi:hypothetical protein
MTISTYANLEQRVRDILKPGFGSQHVDFARLLYDLLDSAGALPVTPTGGASGTLATHLANPVIPRSTSTELEDVEDAINTTDKIAGKAVINTTSGAIVTAEGAAADDVWLGLDGTTDHTPI